MSESEHELLIGRLAIHYQLLDKQQMQAARLRKRDAASPIELGDFLVAEGLLDAAQLSQLQRARQQYLGRQTTGGSPAAEPLATVEPVAVDRLANLRFSTEISLADLLREAHRVGASDLHLHSGSPLKVRLDGALSEVEERPIEAPEAERLIAGLLSTEQRQALDQNLQLDLSYEIEDVGRFRANIYRQRRGLDAVFRTIPLQPPSLAQLGLPDRLAKLTEFHQGMVLITGPAGCGKSTTLAALVDLINRQRADHIITIEDPIELVHRSKRCVVNQREVGPHTESFARALRAALREDPDVIAIGELRDLETISLALTAAETGHLVLGTLHTSSAVRTVNRLLGVFPPEQQSQIRTMVSESLRAVVSQRLLPRADGEGRVAALEVLINNQAAGNLIRDNKTFQLQSVIQTGSEQGMCMLDASLQQLLKQGAITLEVALDNAEDPKRFKDA